MNDETLNRNLYAYSKLARHYAIRNIDRSAVIPEIKAFAILLPHRGKLLDLGCGVGFDSRDFSKFRPDLEILGVDVSKEMLQQFTKIAKGIKYKQTDMRNLKFKPATFDGIWMNATLLHIPKNEAKLLLSDLYSILRLNGYLYISVKEGQGQKLVKATKYGVDVERFFAFFTKVELIKLVSSTNFKILDTQRDVKGNTVWIRLIAQKS